MDSDGWLRLEIRHLAALRAIAEEGTFGRAAARLGYTQSAISQQIAALERIVAARLLDRPRGRGTVGLTEAGELVLRHADAMMARAKAAQADLEALAAGSGAAVRVGTYQSVGARILPEVMHRFSEAWPETEIQLREAPGDAELLRLVEEGELDLTFGMLPVLEGPFETLELLRDPYVLVVRADSPLAERATPPTLEEIAALPLIGFRSCRNEQRVEAHLRGLGFEPRVTFRSDDNGTVQGLVAARVGAALVPRLTVDATDPRTAV
ncbi:MAG: LysR family transcriptional regulator, partial [Actinomycetota bacterium]|nr:LysR family transcriptional regulator [Actinomycetota bacterium]